MIRLLQISLVLLAVSLVRMSAAEAPAYNIGEGGLLMRGFDPVAYFTVGAALPGDPKIALRHGDLLLYFTSEANRARFAKAPSDYLPAFGGHCAYGIALGQRLDSDPAAWRIVGGKLHLFLNRATREMWLLDEPGTRATAERLWQNERARRIAAD